MVLYLGLFVIFAFFTSQVFFTHYSVQLMIHASAMFPQTPQLAQKGICKVFNGLRLSSVISLNVEDVDIETGLLQIIEKGGKQRQLIMPKSLCFILNQYFGFLENQQGPLFLSKRNKRLPPRALHDIFQKAAHSLAIDKHLHAHLF